VTAAARTLLQAFGSAADSLAEVGLRSWRSTGSPAEPPRPSILPSSYLVEFIAGTFGPASSGLGLTEHLQSEQQVRRVVTRTNVGVMAAQDLEENARRKLEEVHVTRAVKCKHTIEGIVEHVASSARREGDRPHVIREAFSFDDSPVAQQIAVGMAESRFLERLARASSGIPEGPLARWHQASTAGRFVDLEGRFRTELASFVPEFEVDDEGVRHAIADDKALKIINRIFDAIAPRMFLIGHSQGGLVALRAMQLGMRRVQVKDARRFLYSPRSGRVHRYSPVALAIGLGAPFDGIDRSPSLIDGRKGEPLSDEALPGLVKRLMPGVGQMLRGSGFLKTLRSAFIPFDCSALSIANPRDGFVPLDQTRLPAGDFRNMHNLEVASSGRFDLIDLVPRLARPAFVFEPARGLRRLLNEDARFQGLREHCSFLVDLDVNWDVDRGEIVRQIFEGENAPALFDEMMFEVNFDGLREQLMANLLYRLRGTDRHERRHLAWMTPRLQHMVREEQLPFLNSLDKRAGLALHYMEPQ